MTANLQVTVASGDVFDVREFNVHQGMSSLFTVTLTALCSNADVDFGGVIGKEASFRLHGPGLDGAPRTWNGICSELHQLKVEEAGLSTYHIRIVPRLWLASQRQNHRIFQNKTELEIATQILEEWGVEIDKRITGTYKSRKYRVQYAETDFVFASRMLEEAGISFYFAEKDNRTVCVLADAPQSNNERSRPIAFRDAPNVADKEHVTDVCVSRQIRPGKVTLRDHDYRRPAAFSLGASAAAGGVEESLENFEYTPGAFIFSTDKGDPTPHADDHGMHRADESEGQKLAEKRLHAARSDSSVTTFNTNVIDLAPGSVLRVLDHPQRELASDKRQLVLESVITGRRDEELLHSCHVRSADQPYHPPLRQAKPKVSGVESATVVGPAGEEIHTDEFGRVRVQFHWDREGARDAFSSCWIHVSQPWSGAGFGGSNLPRIGQEVIVDFLGGDPDRPVITGRVYTNLQKTPYKLPENKTQSGWKTNSSPNTGGYNELMFEDKAGSELLRMRAEKDMATRVNHDKALSVGRDRSAEVQRDDEERVTGNQTQAVGGNQLSRVFENLLSLVGGDRVMKTIGNLVSQAATHAISGDRSITLNVGGSQISIDNDKIIIKANLVLINPE
jgi:type VI secretion system secreted protein VgrG